jgi:hypothetical protein
MPQRLRCALRGDDAMNYRAFAGVAAVVLGATAVCLVLSVGCETGTGLHALVVEPQEANLLGGTNNTVTFMVVEGLRGLSLPLKWDVSNTDLGSIVHQGGYGATYEAAGIHGVNSVFVEDQYGAQGLASVRQ